MDDWASYLAAQCQAYHLDFAIRRPGMVPGTMEEHIAVLCGDRPDPGDILLQLLSGAYLRSIRQNRADAKDTKGRATDPRAETCSRLRGSWLDHARGLPAGASSSLHESRPIERTPRRIVHVNRNGSHPISLGRRSAYRDTAEIGRRMAQEPRIQWLPGTCPRSRRWHTQSEYAGRCSGTAAAEAGRSPRHVRRTGILQRAR